MAPVAAAARFGDLRGGLAGGAIRRGVGLALVVADTRGAVVHRRYLRLRG